MASDETRAEGTAASHARALVWLGPLAALLGAAFALFHDAENGLGAVLRLRDELAEAELRLDALRVERGELVTRAERLRVDATEIESVARESLGMVRPGEIVVRLPAASAPRVAARGD